MTSKVRTSCQIASTSDEEKQSSVLDTNDVSRRGFLKGGTTAAASLRPLCEWVMPASAALITSNTAHHQFSRTTTHAATDTLSKSLKYSLESAAPLLYAGGTVKAATVMNIPALSGVSLASVRINPGAMQEVHWHTNANELSYVLSGQGEFGILAAVGQPSIFTIQQGSASFVPTGAAHFIRNTGPGVLHLLMGFSNEDPQHIDFSASLGYVPHDLLAQNFELPAQSFPFLPQPQDQFLVNVGGSVPLTGVSSSPSTINTDTISPATFSGGTLVTVSSQVFPALNSIAVVSLQGKPGAFREPHWHPNAAELAYVVQGTAQFGVIAPNLQREIVEVHPGDVVFVPPNFLHYESAADEPLVVMAFFSNSLPSHIDLSQVMTSFPHGLIATSFGPNVHLFDNIPNLGDVTLVAKGT